MRPGLVQTKFIKNYFIVYIMLCLETDIVVQKYLTIDAIFSIHYSQIENKESEKHVKVRFVTVLTNLTLGVG